MVELIEMLTNNDLHSELSLDDGATVYLTYMQAGDSLGVYVVELDDGQLWLSLILTSDPDESLPHWKIGNYELADYVDYEDLGETMRVGDPDLGYVDVPATWVEFTDVDAPDTFQYSDSSGKNIITLYTLEPDELGFDGTLEDLAYTYASSLAAEYASDERDDVELDGAYRETMDGHEAYIVVTSWDDGTSMVSYVVAGDERVHCIALEGDPSTVYTLEELVFYGFGING